MKTKSFNDYFKKRLTQHGISDLEKQAEIEFKAIKLLQQDVSFGIKKYMTKLCKL